MKNKIPCENDTVEPSLSQGIFCLTMPGLQGMACVCSKIQIGAVRLFPG